MLLLASLLACSSSSDGTPPPRTDPSTRDDAETKLGADGTKPAKPPAKPTSKPSGPPPDVWPALPKDLTPPKSPDGLPILRVTATPPAETGALREVSSAWNTLDFAEVQASDGLTTFMAVRSRFAGGYSDFVIRGGELRTNVLQALAGTEAHPGGCGAAADGTMLLTAPAPIPGQPPPRDLGNNRRTGLKLAQEVLIVNPDGTMVRHRLPPEAGHDSECTAILERVDRFSIFAGNLSEYDGTTFQIERNWSAGRTHLSRPFGPRYCFESCNTYEQAGTDAKVVTALETALGGCSALYTVLGELIAARCADASTVVRLHVGGKVETLTGLPTAEARAVGLVLTRDGDVVIELGPKMKRYVVWPAGAKAARPERTLANDEWLAETSPTVLVQGLPSPVPPADVYAVVLGQTLPFGASGSTYGYNGLRAGSTAHEARSQRAAAVLPAGDFVLAHEAAVQRSCGAYVRSPLGWEGEEIDDWSPPTLPPLSSKAVHVPASCLPLAEVHAVPGAPDLLLARTEDGQLALAWLPPPLPLPTGRDPREDEPAAPPLVQDPRPGSGWTVVGPVDRIAGDRGLPSPGGNTAIADGSWQAGGGAVLEIGDSTLVLTPHGAWTIPRGTTPMAVQTGPTTGRLYGALGPMLVVCEQVCRTLDPGDGRDIVGVVPRTELEVILGFGNDVTAVYTVPKTGGTETPPHALEAPLEAQLAARPGP